MRIISETWNNLIWIFDRNLITIISIQYIVTLLLCYINYDFCYLAISNLLGYSIFSNLSIATKIFKQYSKKALIAKSMLVSLLISNTFSILANFVTRDFYISCFDKYFLIATTVIIYLILKKYERNSF